MSSDEPIFLVSMCGTPEEFLAAFRRYVDRHGLFVPTTTPAPALQSGRFALTLADGRILIEGDADIASSSPRPSALYGRTGMTVHFTSVDDDSKAVLFALEKAKLSIKAPTSAVELPARPSRLTEPVSHPPPRAGGSVTERAQALAECVVVGDLSRLTPVRVVGRVAGAPPKAGPRFVIPQIQAQPASALTTPSAARATPHVEPVDEPPGDAPGDTTEVGPIIEESAIQASGPTLTNPGLVAPVPPEALAAAVRTAGASGVHVDQDVESTLGGPPPMPTSPASRSSAGLRPPSASGAAPRGELRAGSSGGAMAPLSSAPVADAAAAPPVASNGVGATPDDAPAAPAIPRTTTQQRASEPVILKRPERRSYSQIRRTSLGLAATHIEPAAAGAAQPLADGEAVPEAVHDSMFATEAMNDVTNDITHDVTNDITHDVATGAVPEPSDGRVTQREGSPRPPPRPPSSSGATPRASTAGGSPPPFAATSTPGLRRMTQPRMAIDGAPETRMDGGSLSGARPPLPSYAPPSGAVRAPTAPLPSLSSRPSTAPGRLGRSSESLPVARPPTDSSETGGAPGAPRRMPTPPSVPTVPIRPPIPASSHPASSHPASSHPASSPITAPSNGPSGSERRPSAPNFAMASPVPGSGPGPATPPSNEVASAAALHAGAAGAPLSIDDAAFATVPTTVPPQHAMSAAIGLRTLGLQSIQAEIQAEQPATRPPSVGDPGPRLGLGVSVDSVDTSLDPNLGPSLGPNLGPSLDRGAEPLVTETATAALADSGPQLEKRPSLPFSDTASVSEPLNAVAGARPPMPFESLRAASPGPGDGTSAEVASDAAAMLADDAGDRGREAAALEADGSAAPVVPAVARAAAARSDDSARHARARQAAIDAKVEIDPALYAESAIAQSFEDNFVLPSGERPPGWHAPQAPWESAPIAPPPPAPYYRAPEPSYSPPSYDMAYPVAFHSGDETALVSAPDVGRRRSLVIVGSAIMVLLAGAALYILLDRARQSGPATPSPSPRGEPADPRPAGEPKQVESPPTSATESTSSTGPGETPAAAAAALPDGPTALPAEDAAAVAAPPTRPVTADTSCSTELTSDPVGATVLLDGKQLGVTPFTAALPCHPVTLTFRKAGTADVARTITPPADGKPISVALGATVEILILTNPPGARVLVNDQELGRSPQKYTAPAGVELTLSSTKSGRTTSVKVVPTTKNRKFTLVIKGLPRPPHKAPTGKRGGLDDF